MADWRARWRVKPEAGPTPAGMSATTTTRMPTRSADNGPRMTMRLTPRDDESLMHLADKLGSGRAEIVRAFIRRAADVELESVGDIARMVVAPRTKKAVL